MDTGQIAALITAVVMLLTGIGSLIVSLRGQRVSAIHAQAQRDNVAVDTANDALTMARETWRERLSLLEQRVEVLSAELDAVKEAQRLAVTENRTLKMRVSELERENHELRAFGEQLRLRNEALARGGTT